MGTLQNLFVAHAPQYLARFGEAMPAPQRKVIAAILACRTAQAGSVLFQCCGCGKPHCIARCCGNRHCPACQGRKAYQWLERQLARALPIHHFMLTFTVPEPLRAFIRSHPHIGYDALFAASAGAIKTLAADSRFGLGNRPGFFGVLHTWGRTLQYHPHIHYLMPGGALSSADQQWHWASAGFLLPVHALSVLFRAKFRDAIERAGLLENIPSEIWTIAWNVNCQAVGPAQASLAYLARYLFKVAIAEGRILDFDEASVRFSYRKPHSNRPRTMTLAPMEFIRRFLQHVLPTGFVKVRYYGFLAPTFSVPREEVRARVEMAQGFMTQPVSAPIDAPAPPPGCSHCGGVLRFVRVLRQLTFARPALTDDIRGCTIPPQSRPPIAAGP